MVDHLVVGGGMLISPYICNRLDLLLGVIGLAIARRLAERFPTKSTFVVERHAAAGQETR